MNAQFQPRRAWGIASLLFIFMAVNFVDKTVVGLLAVPMMDELKLTPQEFGLVGSSFFWLFSIAGVIGGFISNRVATTVMLLVMAVAWSVFQLPMALSSSLAVLIISRVLLGIAEGPAFPVAVHACYKWFPSDRRNVPVTVFSQGAGVGLLLAGIGIPLITAHWGWRANFYLLGVVGIVWAVLWKVFGGEGQIDTEHAAASAGVQQARLPYRRLLLDRTVLGCFLLHFVAFLCLALSLTWLPAYLQRGLGFSNIESGRIYAAIVAVGVPAAIGVSWISQRMLARGASSRVARGVFSAVLLIVSGLAFVCLLSDALPVVWRIVAIAMAMSLSPVIYSLGPAMLADVTPGSQRGAVLAIDNSIASLAGVGAPLLMGYWVQHLGGAAGYHMGFAVCGVLMVAGGIISVWMINPERSARSVGQMRQFA
ncbi:MFS transporter [Variovorax robiniae]|uniref:MFS transporter n=1 Tax=Variovorax robiniae TaxID=1836199 RepID=A0ABU8XEK8_9BURK